MKITGAKTTVLPSRAGSRDSHCVLELQSDEGASGNALAPASAQHHVAPLLGEILLNADPRAVTLLWSRLSQANQRADGALTATIAAIDIALWDLKAKLNTEPLWRTLGGLRPRINAHVRLESDIDVDAWCRTTPGSTRGVVLASGGNVASDTTKLVRLREAFANQDYDCELMLDADERWSPKDAIRALSEIERNVDVAWVEAPIVRGDFLGHKRIGDSIRSAVCAGGRFGSAAEFLPHLHHHSLNVVQLDTARVGITAALQIADAAYGFELPIALTRSPGNLHAHLAAALPYCATMELDDRAIESDIRIENGWAIGGDRPGHGCVFT